MTQLVRVPLLRREFFYMNQIEVLWVVQAHCVRGLHFPVALFALVYAEKSLCFRVKMSA